MQKTISTLSAILFFTSLLSAQQIQISWNNQKGSISDEVRFAGSIAYYASKQKNGGILLRMDYFKHKDDYSYVKMRTDLLQIDLAQRWYTSLSKKIKAYLEVGISATTGRLHYSQYVRPISHDNFDERSGTSFFFPYSTVAPTPYWQVERQNTDVVFLTSNQIEGKKKYYLQVLPGFVYGKGLDVSLGKNFVLGLHLQVKYYFNTWQQKQLLSLVYGSHIGFRF
ncbi:MAG TPA: hypothetical protein ENJ45_03960 [Phaeodactylibacter sp.]|nr:hypothetical protein [Phaeodactylibacter sp.]